MPTRAVPDKADLATLRPDLANEWHPTFNGDLHPSQFTAGSTAVDIWWKCTKNHEYQMRIAKRALHGYGCPYCSGRRTICGVNDLLTLLPEAAQEWDHDRNDRSPESVKPGSEYKAWWKCRPRGHSYQLRIDRWVSAKCACPYCGGRLPIAGENDLGTLVPEIAVDWHPDKNSIGPDEVLIGSNKPVWWKCRHGHEWRAQIASRSSGKRTGCPVCSNRRVESGVNDLATLRPDLAAEWHPTRNQLTPGLLSTGSARSVWWLCTTGRHEWEDTISTRSRGYGCPICSGKRALAGFNDLSTLYPEIASQWDYSKNALEPQLVRPGSNYTANWICAKNHQYPATVAARVRGRGCPYCVGKQTLPGFNDLSTRRPDLAKEWHATRNVIQPSEVTGGSRKLFWWSCNPYGHEYQAEVSARSAGNGCPICSGRRVKVGFNDLATTYPELANEWHATRNKTEPSQVTSGSNRKAWWSCTESHEWQATISSRAAGRGCSRCKDHGSSKREAAVCEAITKILGIAYTGPQRLPSWPGAVDLIIHDHSTVVEYDGWYWHFTKSDTDKRKTLALEEAGWNVVRIRESKPNCEPLPLIPGTLIPCTDSEDPGLVAIRVVAALRKTTDSSCD
jgi:hypothetical protein